jgi:hypothetical protein
MTDTDVDQPSPEAAPPPRTRRLAADPMDRVVPVLSTEPPKGLPRRPGRAGAVARKVCATLIAAFIILCALVALVDETDPGHRSSLSGSMR